MGSNISAVKCNNCGRSAIEDFYYKTNEKYTFCRRCGYNYTKKIIRETANHIEFEEDERKGHGVLLLVKKDEICQTMLFNSTVTKKQIEENKALFMSEETDQEKSYFVTFNNGVFDIIVGNPPENFHLPFEEYKEKMRKKYGDYEYFDALVPIED